MSNNLDLYNKVREVPEEAAKSIDNGKLKGYTDINPMWRIKVLTEQFGICGIGWKTKTIRKWIEEGANGEKSAFCDIELYIKVDGIWSEAIEGNGGNSFVSLQNKKIYENNKMTGTEKVLVSSDECFKMAYTDALSVACKAIGIGADVYFKNDRSKYTNNKDDNVTDINIEVLEKVKKILWYASGKNQEKSIELLEKHTSFVGKDGKQVAGLNDFNKLKDKRLTATYGKLQREYPDICKAVKELFLKKEKKAV
jgi:hypothetical protein